MSSTSATVTYKTIKPIGNRALIRRDDAADKTPGGIVLPDKGKEKPRMGTVISTGEGLLLNNGTLIPVPVKENQKVIFASYAGSEVRHGGEDLLVIEAGDILGIIE